MKISTKKNYPKMFNSIFNNIGGSVFCEDTVRTISNLFDNHLNMLKNHLIFETHLKCFFFVFVTGLLMSFSCTSSYQQIAKCKQTNQCHVNVSYI